MVKLHELTAAGQQITALMDTSYAPDEWHTALEAINTEINDKIIACGCVYRNLNAEADVYEIESKRLADKAVSLIRQAEYLRQYVEHNMDQLNLHEIKADTFKVKWRKLPDIVEITDNSIIPASYTRIIPQRVEPDKIAIKEALQNGEKVTGAELITDRRKLEIK